VEGFSFRIDRQTFSQSHKKNRRKNENKTLEIGPEEKKNRKKRPEESDNGRILDRVARGRGRRERG